MLGQPPAPDKLGQYLEAYFGDSLSPEAVEVVSQSSEESLDAVKAKLQRMYSQVGFELSLYLGLPVWAEEVFWTVFCAEKYSACLVTMQVPVIHTNTDDKNPKP